MIQCVALICYLWKICHLAMPLCKHLDRLHLVSFPFDVRKFNYWIPKCAGSPLCSLVVSSFTHYWLLYANHYPLVQASWSHPQQFSATWFVTVSHTRWFQLPLNWTGNSKVFINLKNEFGYTINVHHTHMCTICMDDYTFSKFTKTFRCSS